MAKFEILRPIEGIQERLVAIRLEDLGIVTTVRTHHRARPRERSHHVRRWSTGPYITWYDLSEQSYRKLEAGESIKRPSSVVVEDGLTFCTDGLI